MRNEPIRASRQKGSVLVADPDRATRHFLADNLAADGYRPTAAATAAELRRALATTEPSGLVLDPALADGDGLELLAELRSGALAGAAVDRELPVILVSARANELDRLRGFHRGCDDYVVKPFSYQELLARLAAVLRRVSRQPPRAFVAAGTLRLDALTRRADVEGEPLKLTEKEFALLYVLATEPDRVCSRAELLRVVWGYRSLVATRTLDVHVSRLRTKLAATGGPAIANVWGVGYRLTAAEPGAGRIADGAA